MKELETVYDNRKSFYGKARLEMVMGQKSWYLWSYRTHVATLHIPTNEIKVYNLQSQTTVRHVREFIMQAGHAWMSKREIMEKFMV